MRRWHRRPAPPMAAGNMASASCDPTSDLTASIGDTHIRLLPDGPQRLSVLLALIGGAQQSLRLLFYIFRPDSAGTKVRDALVEAARRGVAVTLLADSFGSSKTADSFFDPLRAAGGTALWFGSRWTPRYLIRNHQKLVIADEAQLMSGGFNVEDAYFAPASDPEGWNDLGFLLEGSAVPAAVQWFDLLAVWMARPRPRFRDLTRMVRQWRDPSGRVRWLVGGPSVRLSPWARSFRQDLARADNAAVIMAYFAPNAGVLRRIAGIAQRGGAARLLLPAYSDNGATVGAARLLYGFLLKRGVVISEYLPQRLHSKLIVLDDIVLIGSANLDMRSLYVNMELVLRIRDAAFAGKCLALIARQEAHAEVITPALHRQRAGLLNRIRWFASWLVVSAIDYSVTRRLNFGLNHEQR